VAILRIDGEENQLLAAALGYARRGWRVLPLHDATAGACSCGKAHCDSAGKHPRTRHGPKDATADEAVIRGWWAEWPAANVGVATGPESGLYMVGPDGPAGVEALAELEARHGPLPDTPRLRSGGGGQHRYFAWPAGGGIRNGANYNGLPIDVRGAGGLAVAPPSLHASGQRYAWEAPPESTPLAEAPAWLLDWLRNGKGTRKPKGGDRRTKAAADAGPGVNGTVAAEPPANGKVLFTVGADRGGDVQARAAAYLEKCDPAVSGQGGHGRTFEVARAVVYGFDLGPDLGFDLLSRLYNPRCLPPWSEKELRHKCAEADVQPFAKPRGYLLHDGDGDGPAPAAAAPPDGEEDIEALPMPPPAPWPVLPPEALHGLAGEVVRTIAPETESDPVAILAQMLVGFGNSAGRGPHFQVEGDSHHTNLFACLVGETSRGRKGTSRGRVLQLMGHADDAWVQKCIAGGMSSGEGLIWAVRDPIEKKEPVKHKGRVTGYQTVIADEGVADKRLLADESEFAQVLKVLQREGNSLSPVIRQSWDTGRLRTLTKHNPARATGAHISISAHITRPELARHLKDTEALNGFANRFLWLCVRRSRLLPDGGGALDLSPLGVRLNYALAAARGVGAMTRGEAAARLWREAYPRLTAERPGVYGAVTGRAEAQTLRLSMVYALLDGQSVIGETHLRAALALWSYADASARLIFGFQPEDPLVELVLGRLRGAPAGMTRTQLRDAFHRNLKGNQLLEALARLRDRGLIVSEPVWTGGRNAERWRLRPNDRTTEVAGNAAFPEASDPLRSFGRSVVGGGGEEVVTV
jgi:hypothetical protein